MLPLIRKINEFVWSGPMLILLLGTHLYFTCSLHFVQRKIKYAIRLSLSSDSDSHGNASNFSTLTTTLAATLGTGNIVGVSTAIALGGPGAVFWCWITGILGMATTYAECYLGMIYRKKDNQNKYQGGPMYAIEYGLKNHPLAVFFSLCVILSAFSMGCSTQVKAITDVTKTLGISNAITGMLTAMIIGLVILGGVSQIQKICIRLVPLMAFFYIGGCTIILIMNAPILLETIKLILVSAFRPHCVTSGILGGSIGLAARYGIARGLFTNEAGLGSAAIAAASSTTTDPKKQALVSMSATFWDTVVMCAVTGLVIVTTLVGNPKAAVGLSMSELTKAAFSSIPLVGNASLAISLICFASATIIGWCYLGEKAVNYLFHKKGILIYRSLYIFMIFLGAIMSLDLVWETADLINAVMLIPNIIVLFALRKQIHY